MSETKHTPTPWQAVETSPVSELRDEYGNTIGRIWTTSRGTFKKHYYSHEATAARIVLCVNAHDALVEALSALVREVEKIAPERYVGRFLEQARAALALAKGGAQ